MIARYTLSIVRDTVRQDGLTKPKIDINNILQQLGFGDISCKILTGKKEKIFSAYKSMNNISCKLHRGDVLLIHYPTDMGNFFDIGLVNKLKRKGIRLIALIHDIDSLRFNVPLYRGLNYEVKLLNRFSVIISPNSSMSDLLKKRGLKTKIIELDIFDYLTKINVLNRTVKFKRVVSFAGNLNKSKFVYNLVNTDGVQFKIYGPTNNRQFKSSSIYQGSYDSDELISMIDGGFGLIWDGSDTESIDTRETTSGSYLQYNNPYKLSFSIAAGIPVFVWSKAASASFVEKYNIGYTISSINDITTILKGISDGDYSDLCKNVKYVQAQIVHGEYTKRAVEKALRCL